MISADGTIVQGSAGYQDTLRERCLAASEAIGRKIVGEAIPHEEGCSWMSAIREPGTNQLAMRSMNPWLYNGASGVAVFLTELFYLTEDEEYLDCSRKALEFCVSSLNHIPLNSHSGFFAGFTGLAYALHRYATISGHPRFDETASELLGKLRQTPEKYAGDVIGGAAGCIPALLTLFSPERFPFAKETALLLGDVIVRTARHHPGGRSSWGPPGRAISRDLCGYAHGASGYAAALMELWLATKDDLFQYLALKAIAYEESLFSVENRGWPDLRALSFQELIDAEGEVSLRKRIELGDRIENELPAYTNVWCHGAPGIGLARLRAYQLWREEPLASSAEAALSATKEALVGRLRNFSLCHGIFGNLETVRLGSQVLHSPNLQWVADELTATALDRYEKLVEAWPCGTPGGQSDPSLMLGLSGIGYSLLRVAQPRIASMLAPHQDIGNTTDDSTPTSLRVQQHASEVFSYWFKTSREVASRLGVSVERPAFDATFHALDFSTAFVNLLNDGLAVDSRVGLLVRDAAAPELARWRRSSALRCRSVILKERWGSGVFESFDLSRVAWRFCSERAELVTTQLDWPALVASDSTFTVGELSERFCNKAEYSSFVIYESFERIELRAIQPFARLVLEAIQAQNDSGASIPALLTDIRDSVAAHFDESNLKQLISTQLRSFHSAGIIEPVTLL